MRDRKIRVNIWILGQSKAQLRKIAAETDESMGEVVECLLADEYGRVMGGSQHGSRARPAIAQV